MHRASFSPAPVLVLMLILAAFLVLAGTGLVATAQETPDPTGTPTPPPSLADAEPAILTGERREAFEAYITEAMDRHGVPGAAVAVVQGGEVVFLEGFGVKELGSQEPVTPDTLMMIGSITKSMTSMMTATLVDEGWVSWDTPVAELLPDFALTDPELTQQVTLADSFCACTGIPRRDAEIIFNIDMLGPEALIAQVAELPLTAPFGERFQYSNQMYGVGGYAAAVAAGAARNDLYDGYIAAMRDRLLNPMGMTRSTFALDDVLGSGDYALPHAMDIEGQTRQIPVLLDSRFVHTVAPAGALWSSAQDMARYLQTQLSDGIAPDGTQVVSSTNLLQTREPAVATPPVPPELPAALAESATHYGMGWVIGEWRGQPLVHHDGGTFGFTSLISFLPEADLGIVLLTNGIQGGIFNVDVRFSLFEILFDQEPEFGALAEQFLGMQAAQLAQVQAQLRPADPDAVAPYVGRYSNPALGEVDLALREGRLVFDAGDLRSELRALADETGQTAAYVFADPPLAGPSPVTFQRDGDGRPEMVATIMGEDGEPLVYVFTQE